MTKRAAIIIIVLVVLLGTAFLYFLIGGRATPGGMPLFPGSPFGTPPDDEPTTPGTTPGEGEPPGTGGKPLPRFVKLSEAPVSGAIGFLKNGSTYVRYVDRATGHVYDMNPATLERARIVNTTQPRVYEAVFRPDAAGYVARGVAEGGETISNTIISLTPPATSTDPLYKVQSTPIRGGIGDIALLPNGNLVYNLEDTGVVITSSFTGTNPRTLFSMPFSEWRIYSVSNTSAVLVTKASESAEGYAYRLNIANGGLTKLLGPLAGLTVLPNADGTRLAFSEISNSPEFGVVNTGTGGTLNIVPVTLSEKCVWSRLDTSLLICAAPEGGLGLGAPDRWYDGTLSYSDQIWRFNTNTDTAEILLEPKRNFETDIDAINLSLSPDEDYLFFINKRDLSLWALKLVP